MKSSIRPRLAPPSTTDRSTGSKGQSPGNAALCELIRSGGRSAPRDVLDQARSSWGVDVSNARVHTGAAAAAEADARGVEGFAWGQDLFFGSGTYQPDDPHGRFVLLHELAHAGGTGAAPLPDETVTLAHHGGAEAEADAAAAAAMEGRRRPLGGAPVGLHAFGATAHRDEQGVRDADSISHENQTLDAALGAGLTQEQATMLYSGNWQRDLNQLILASTESFAVPLYELLDIAHHKHFGFGLPAAEEFGGYDPVEHIDNPGGLEAGDNRMGRHASVGEGATLAESDDRYGSDAWAVNESGIPAYIEASRVHILDRLHEAVAVGGDLDDEGGRGLRLAGEALHTIQDFFAHSNFCEIALNLWVDDGTLLEMGIGDGSGRLDTQVHAVTSDGSVASANATSGDREILATGTFLTTDTVQSLKEKTLAMLHELDPFAAGVTKPDPWVVAIIDWMQCNPQFVPGGTGSMAAMAGTVRAAVPAVQGICAAIGAGQQAAAGVHDAAGVAASGALGGASDVAAGLGPWMSGVSDMLGGAADQAATAGADGATYCNAGAQVSADVAAQFEAVAAGIESEGGVSALYVLAYDTYQPLLSLSSWVQAVPVVGPLLVGEVRRLEAQLRQRAREALHELWEGVVIHASGHVMALVNLAVGETEVDPAVSGAPWAQPTHTDIAKDFDANHHGSEEEASGHTHAGAWLAPLADDLAHAGSDAVMTALVACWNGAASTAELDAVVDRFFAHPADNRAEWEPLFTGRLGQDAELVEHLEAQLS